MYNPLPIIIGTAGHVDHGKTSLVRALTNFETDRHPEEKERGMSIDFAVAPYFIDSDRVVGIVDVPGHIDFIRNMTAGASSIDLALLVVAADDGVMPQTREHIQILSHLGVKLVLPVITKIDLSDPTLTELLNEELLTLLEESKLKVLESTYVSNQTGEGIDVLKERMLSAVEMLLKSPEKEDRAFRMYIRTAFNFKGSGTVVTGIPCSGAINSGSKVEILTSRVESTSIRSIQNYRAETNHTEAHISSAINLRNIELGDIERGLVLAEPEVFISTKEIYAWVKNSSNKRIVRARDYQVHIGTLSVTGKAYPIGALHLEPNTEGALRIKFQREIQTSAGDRLLLRDGGTVGGGVVISIFGKGVRKRYRESKLAEFKDAIKSLNEEGRFDLCELYACGEYFLSDLKLSAILQRKAVEEADGAGRRVGDLKVGVDILKIAKNLWFNLHQKEHFEERLISLLNYYHKINPYQPGMLISNLNRLFKIEGVEAKDLSKVLEAQNKIKVSGNYILLSSFKPPFTQKELAYIDKIKALIKEQAGISKVNLLTGINLSEKDSLSLFNFLEKEKTIFNFSNFYFDSDFVKDLRSKAELLLVEKKDGFTMAEFRELTGVSRNQAVPVLDYLDREGVTKRVGDKRVAG